MTALVRCLPRLPGGPLRPMKWAMIFEIWYYLASLCDSVSGVRPRAR
jgi:hypothetical protein